MEGIETEKTDRIFPGGFLAYHDEEKKPLYVVAVKETLYAVNNQFEFLVYQHGLWQWVWANNYRPVEGA